MIVTRGGKAYEPSNDPAIIAPKQKDMSHAAFVLWETMIGLQLERKEAVNKWERIELLHQKADMFSEHQNVGKLYARIRTLESEVLAHQRAFLDYEEIARREWDRLTPYERKDQEIDHMYNNYFDSLPPTVGPEVR